MLFSDISYICGVLFCYFQEFESTNQYAGIKKSSEHFIKTFKRYLWRYIHESDRPKIQRPILREMSPEGFYDERVESD